MAFLLFDDVRGGANIRQILLQKEWKTIADIPERAALNSLWPGGLAKMGHF